MKKRHAWILVLLFAFAAWPAFADGTAAIAVAQPSDPLHDIINSVIPIVIAGLTAILAWISKTVKSWLSKAAADSKTSESSKFYALAFNLAGMAVKLAETKFGPDSGTGMKKRQEAVDWLRARLQAVDPKIKISDNDLNGFVDAAYHDVFAAVSPLAGGAGR